MPWFLLITWIHSWQAMSKCSLLKIWNVHKSHPCTIFYFFEISTNYVELGESQKSFSNWHLFSPPPIVNFIYKYISILCENYFFLYHSNLIIVNWSFFEQNQLSENHFCHHHHWMIFQLKNYIYCRFFLDASLKAH